MTMPKVLISDKMSPIAEEILGRYPEIEFDVKTGMKPEELIAVIGAYDGLMIRSATKVTPEVFAAAGNLKIIARAGTGVDNIHRESANKNGTYITNTPGGNTVTTAEHAIGMMMALTRNIPQGTATLKAGEWAKSKLQGREVFKKTLGIVGFGNIGRVVADRAKGLRMNVIAYDKYPNEDAAKEIGVEMVGLDELLERSDYISMHLIKTPETTGFVTAEIFAKMKKGVFFINCGRGGIVDEDALFEALENGTVAGAALDVFASEPPGEHRLLTLPNVIATPHLGASTQEAQDNVAIAAAEQVADYLTKGELRNALNADDIRK